MPKIIQVCGTNGAGKTTVVRKFLAQAKTKEDVYIGKKHTGYLCTFYNVHQPVRVIGEYSDAPTGGVDKLGGKAEDVFALIESEFNKGFNVVYEGIRIMHHTRGIELQKSTKALNIILLNTTLELAVEGLMLRRVASETTRELRSLSDLKGNHVRARNYALKVADIGGRKFSVHRDEAVDKILEILEEKENG